jgi:hypothetical protein
MLTVQDPGGIYVLWRISPLLGELIRCQSDHDNYLCSCGGAAVGSRIPTRGGVNRRF